MDSERELTVIFRHFLGDNLVILKSENAENIF